MSQKMWKASFILPEWQYLDAYFKYRDLAKKYALERLHFSPRVKYEVTEIKEEGKSWIEWELEICELIPNSEPELVAEIYCCEVTES